MNQHESSELQVGIIGGGWLGCALATELKRHHDQVIVTTTTLEKQPKLKQQGFKCELLSLPDDKKTLNLLDVFKQQQLVICIPPQLKRGNKHYIENIKTLVNAANMGNIQQLILISTTGVYGGLSGKVNEESHLQITHKKVHTLRLAEEELHNFKGNSCIIRFAGLVGEDRHPGDFLAGKTQLTNGAAPVNLIHQRDAVGIIVGLLKSMNRTNDLFVQQKTIVFNGVSSAHPNRKQFYQQAANALKLTPPQFDDKQALTDSKIICAQKIQDTLNYRFVYPDLLAWLT